MQARFDAVLRRVLGLHPSHRIGLAVSGGVDSIVLASLAQSWALPRGIFLQAFVIDHLLRKGSSEEALKVAELLEKQGISTNILRMDMSGADPSKMEVLARDERRRLLERECNKHKLTTLMHGHHLDDQVELMIMRLLGGSGWMGLAGMQPSSWLSQVLPPNLLPVRLLKPLLGFRKKELYGIAEKRGLRYFEDATNYQPMLTRRNAIRKILSETPQSALESLYQAQLLFNKQRTLVTSQALLTDQVLQASGDLNYSKLEGSATLEIQSDTQRLPPAILTQLLYMIIARLAPIDPSQIAYRRQPIVRELIPRLQHKVWPSFKKTLSGLVITHRKGKISFERAPPRATELTSVSDVYNATHSWSEWQLFDGRWWLRWRLPPKDTCEVRQISIKLLGPHAEVINKVFQPSTPVEASAVNASQPFFIIHDVRDPFGISMDRVLGCPTLGHMRGLMVEAKFKRIMF